MKNIEPGLTLLSKDAKLRRIIAETELPELQTSGDVYYDLLESIVSQQISLKAAKSIFGRFLDLFPKRFPEVELLRQMAPETLRTAGVSNQKAGYLINIAQYWHERQLQNTDWSALDDEAIFQLLLPIKGVGKWTVEMVLIFTLLRPDVLPVDDLGIRQAFAKLFPLDGTQREITRQMIEHAEPWRPWRSLACRYLWIWNHKNPNVF